MDPVHHSSPTYYTNGLLSSWGTDSHDKRSSWDVIDTHNYQSSWTVDSHEHKSSWDDPNTTEQKKDSDLPTENIGMGLVKIQLIGVAVVLLFILATVIPLAVILSGISNNSTITPRMVNLFELQSLTCGNMTIFENTVFSGMDLVSAFQNTYNSCCTACLTTTYCVGFIWNITENICYQKSSISSIDHYDVNFISAKY